MTINISEILANPSVIKEFKVEPEFDVLDLKQGSYPVSQKSPFILTVSNAKGKLHIKGDTEIRLMIPCDRCLDEVEHTFPVHVDCRVNSDKESDGIGDVSEADISNSDNDDDYSFMDGCILDVDKLVRDEIVVALPTKVLCSEDCKGLCSVCGTNLNHGSCTCDRSVGDPRMAAIQDIFRDFNA